MIVYLSILGKLFVDGVTISIFPHGPLLFDVYNLTGYLMEVLFNGDRLNVMFALLHFWGVL